MALDLMREKGVPLERQEFDWHDLVRVPYSKLDDDAFTRVRVILMNGIESEAIRFSHSCARMNRDLQLPLARVRRVEQHQQTMVNWLNPPDQSPIETTIGFEQVAIEVTAAVAQHEPDKYLAQCYRYGLLEDFDHLYRYAALYDRVEGKDANYLVQSYSDIVPARPTSQHHRAPVDDLRKPYDRKKAAPISKIHALTITAAEHQTHDFYMTIGPMFSDPVARQLYAEIASVEEQHVTHYESMIDAEETWLEKWLLHECVEIYNYLSCYEYESNPRIKKIWERFIDYEIGHLRFAMEIFKRVERRDPAEIVPATLPEAINFETHRQFVRKVLSKEADMRAVGTEFIHPNGVRESKETLSYRKKLNSSGSPSELVSAGWQWTPGTELAAERVDASGRRLQ